MVTTVDIPVVTLGSTRREAPTPLKDMAKCSAQAAGAVGAVAAAMGATEHTAGTATPQPNPTALLHQDTARHPL